MIHSVRAGDTVSVVDGDGNESEPFVLAEPIAVDADPDTIFVWRVDDAPLPLPRLATLTAGYFNLHHRP